MNYVPSPELEATVLAATSAQGMQVESVIQSLWSGYGNLLRIRLEGASFKTVVVKHICAPSAGAHPRGWNTDRSHQRKLQSYQVESEWYRRWSEQCDATCRIPRLLGLESLGNELMLILEDLDAAGYPVRLQSVSENQLEACLSWLASFHATFLGVPPADLWPTGTYWHLETRGDELAALDDPTLKQAAPMLDEKLKQARFQTIVHGDAKLANFCFSKDGESVAAVDFQYVGGGCGMKDLAYFIGSCLDEDACERRESELLNRYFTHLRVALAEKNPTTDLDALEAEWRALFPVAWTDFHRFIKGWSPGHWKINSYSERMAQKVIADLGQ